MGKRKYDQAQEEAHQAEGVVAPAEQEAAGDDKRTRANINHFDKLPNELILYLFNMLSHHDLATLSAVSHRFRVLANDNHFWRGFFPSSEQTLQDGETYKSRITPIVKNITSAFPANPIRTLNGHYDSNPQKPATLDEIMTVYRFPNLGRFADTHLIQNWAELMKGQPVAYGTGSLNEKFIIFSFYANNDPDNLYWSLFCPGMSNSHYAILARANTPNSHNNPISNIIVPYKNLAHLFRNKPLTVAPDTQKTITLKAPSIEEAATAGPADRPAV